MAKILIKLHRFLVFFLFYHLFTLNIIFFISMLLHGFFICGFSVFYYKHYIFFAWKPERIFLCYCFFVILFLLIEKSYRWIKVRLFFFNFHVDRVVVFPLKKLFILKKKIEKKKKKIKWY